MLNLVVNRISMFASKFFCNSQSFACGEKSLFLALQWEGRLSM